MASSNTDTLLLTLTGTQRPSWPVACSRIGPRLPEICPEIPRLPNPPSQVRYKTCHQLPRPQWISKHARLTESRFIYTGVTGVLDFWVFIGKHLTGHGIPSGSARLLETHHHSRVLISMTTKISSKSRTLTDHIHRLPRELFDIIYTKTITSPPSASHIQPETYCPPSLLQTDRQTRAKFAESYFSNTSFIISSEEMLTRWLMSLDPKHRAMVKDIRCVLWNESIPEKGSIRAYEHRIEGFNAKLRIEWMFEKEIAGVVNWLYEEDLKASFLLKAEKWYCQQKRKRELGVVILSQPNTPVSNGWSLRLKTEISAKSRRRCDRSRSSITSLPNDCHCLCFQDKRDHLPHLSQA
ncbi:uncharacterized protein MYCFIDRAFT_178810 [Pseudocercospora fijiensis CIRAD86]|uniref:Uncharacterized protein n=1 Tax=Pseudocercospora fijiensis (strain CIRAD86) TaxID=383855 RepID=M3ANL1_PSEFD|nr:uncharacterized protein MYCFIDRAFT_178810 [Pseudocercospora fijiensis CIRAD86]EME78698.1 hypothetical protein MYCFIDRAFT_178810 [Pseudocercospora fijiensis CIRAD86]